MTSDIIEIELEYDEDDEPYLIVLEDLISKAVNEFRSLYPDTTVRINGVEYWR